MKSLCIKTNNQKSIEYLLSYLENINSTDICFSMHQFKIYKNIIIHYTGNELELFLTKISNMLSYLIIDVYEKNILKRIISHEYFYFDELDRKDILNNIKRNSNNIESFKHIFKYIYRYLDENKSINLEGFIPFRLKKYISFLQTLLDNTVNKFLVEREYTEFISLLKIYVDSEANTCDLVYIILSNTHTLLLDNNKNIIECNNDDLNMKYLSDISFSSNDCILNTLLTLLPKKILINLKSEYPFEFLETLKLIFGSRIEICNEEFFAHQ